MSSHGSHDGASADKHIGDEKHPVAHDVAPIYEAVVHKGHGETAANPGAQEKEVRNAALFAAIKESNIQPWSKESIQLYFAIFVAFCCACANGYDGSLMTGIIAMPKFQAMFHTGDTGPKVSVIFSLYTV